MDAETDQEMVSKDSLPHLFLRKLEKLSHHIVDV